LEKNQKRVTKKLDFPKLLERVLKFLSIRPRSRQEIINYLKKKTPQDEALREKVLKKAESLDLIDDRDFAVWWVEQRMTFRPKGKKALFFELRQKGLEKALIEEILNEKINELVLAIPLAQKKWLSLKKLPKEAAQQKLVGFLSRRGFSWEVIKKVLDEIFKKK